MKILVVHHSADYDGLFSGCVADFWLSKNQENEVTVKGWDFGDALIDSGDLDEVHVLDLPPSCLVDYKAKPLTWIDHHKSSIEEFGFGHGSQLDGVAACRLAWQYYQDQFPTLQDFKGREVREPTALTLAGEYDVWDKSDPDAERFQFGLTANRYRHEYELTPFLQRGGDAYARELCKEGDSAMKWQFAYAEGVCADRGYMVEYCGLKFWCLASVHARNSMWFPQGSVPKEADALMCYRIEGNGFISVSLYHKPGREDIDLSVIAKAMRGGGHRGACGFQYSIEGALEVGIIR